MAEGIEQYDKLKNQFFSNLSHELKTPLNVIFATAQLITIIKDNASVTEYHQKVQKHMKIVKQNCYRLMRLIGNLIDITRYDSGFLHIKLGNHNIVHIIEDITLSIVKYAETKGITVTFDTNIEEKYISCDPDMIERVMLNLISNALKFTNNGGNVWVNIDNQGENVMISVRDTGIGIPSDKLSIIFERFRQVDDSLNRNHEGSGIGLSLVKALVEAHNGTIAVNSEYGKGTEVIISLPAKILQDEMLTDKRIGNESKANLVERVSIEFSDIYSSNDF
jgi:signal transduction histidine kinase